MCCKHISSSTSRDLADTSSREITRCCKVIAVQLRRSDGRPCNGVGKGGDWVDRPARAYGPDEADREDGGGVVTRSSGNIVLRWRGMGTFTKRDCPNWEASTFTKRDCLLWSRAPSPRGTAQGKEVRASPRGT